MADWGKLALVHAGIGYQACVLATIRSGGGETVEGLLITAFVLYTICVGMVVAQESGAANKILGIILLLLLFVVGILVIAGLGVWGDQNNSSLGAYNGTIHATSACFALLAAIFLAVGLVSGGGKTGPK